MLKELLEGQGAARGGGGREGSRVVSPNLSHASAKQKSNKVGVHLSPSSKRQRGFHPRERKKGWQDGRTDGRTDGSRSQGCGRPAQRGRGGAGVKEVGVGGVACSTLRQKPTQRNKRPEIESFVFGFLPPVKNCDAL